MAAAMRKVHIGIKNRIFICPLSVLTLKMETIGGSVLRKVCADRSWFNSTKSKETTSPLHLTRGRDLRLHSVLTSCLEFLMQFSVGLAGRFQNRSNKNVRSSQGTKRSKFLKKAQVFVIHDASSCDKLVQCHRSKYAFKMNYIGIEREWVNKEGQVNAPVALLQIATPLCDCFLVRLCKMDGQMRQIVKEFLEDKTVVKFGVGIQDDAKRLRKMFGIHAQGCVDLRHVIQRSQLENEYQRFVICSLSEGIRKYRKTLMCKLHSFSQILGSKSGVRFIY